MDYVTMLLNKYVNFPMWSYAVCKDVMASLEPKASKSPKIAAGAVIFCID